MACSCHGKNGTIEEGKVRADDQCTTCALKHLEMARAAWGEFLYEEANRRWCASHLRLAVEHLKTDHRDAAVKVRDAATVIELAMDRDRGDVKARLDALHAMLLGLFKADNPEYAERLARLTTTPNNK